jgi:hypothetical protein
VFSSILGDRIDDGIKVEGRSLWIIILNVDRSRNMIDTVGNLPWAIIVEMRVGDLILSSKIITEDDFIEIIELIPIVSLLNDISVERFKLWTTRYSHVKCFSSVEALKIKEIEVILVIDIREERVGKSIQIAHDWEVKFPLLVAGTIHILSGLERLMIIEPIINKIILLFI